VAGLSSADEEIDIAEAMRISGRTRDTLMRWKRAGKVAARTVETEYTQRQRRVLFRRSEIEALAAEQS
jgi:NAD(P)H-hydrate repair Nnr-like enzyme with NAD(P)H-hydrate epimerase domain